MKTAVQTLIVLFLVGSVISGCSTVSRVSTENQEELSRVEKMSPQEKAEWKRAQRNKFEPGNLPTQ